MFRLHRAGREFFDSVNQVGAYLAAISALIKPFDAAMLETPNHPSIPYSDNCHLLVKSR